MEKLILQVIKDIHDAAERGSLSLDEQVRAYDLLDLLLSMEGQIPSSEAFAAAASEYCKAFSEVGAKLVFDEVTLKDQAKIILEPYEARLSDARFEAAAVAGLHEFAKEVFEIWQNSGIFARKRALRELRERAGFRLESHRIGNYVAKTFDLANEAQARFAKAQQACFSADQSYKISPGIHERINGILTDILPGSH